jgi:hypothetical protein
MMYGNDHRDRLPTGVREVIGVGTLQRYVELSNWLGRNSCLLMAIYGKVGGCAKEEQPPLGSFHGSGRAFLSSQR